MSWRQSVSDATSRSLVSLALALIGACGSSGIRTADTSVYVRSDTDSTTVIAPRAHVGARLGESVGLDATYAMDSWTGASIDVVTAATTAIHELRHEINTAASLDVKNVRLSANYRYSTENDYWSHGGVINLDVDLFEKNTTLAFALLGSLDTVGRAEWASFRRPQDSIGGRLTYTQVLDAKTLLSLSGEMVRLAGYMASPYRYVGFDGTGLCRQLAAMCVMEIHPHERLRTALSLNLRRAFGSMVSMGLTYRYYFDDWGLDSHTVSPDLTILIGQHGTLALNYRFYFQSHADFYRSSYPGELSSYHYLTRDRKLSNMMSHHVGAEYLHDVPLGASGNSVLQLGLRGGLGVLLYSEFVGLEQVGVVEGTALLGMLFR
jgi:hypothetical protein